MSPRKRIPTVRRAALRQILTQQGQLEDEALQQQLDLLTQMRRETLAALADASGFRVFHLSQVLAAIDREIARGKALAQQLVDPHARAAFRLGNSLVDNVLATIGPAQPNSGIYDLGSNLLTAAIDVTTDQLRGVWSELGSRLKSTVRRTALGIDDPLQAMQSLAQVIRNPKTFANAFARAETIVRTEVNRTFSLATQKRMEQSNKRLGGGLKKGWVNAGDGRVRDAHIQAGEDYALTSKTAIPVDDPFIVDGEALMFPRDPRGSAANTINCRCSSVPFVEDVAAALAAA